MLRKQIDMLGNQENMLESIKSNKQARKIKTNKQAKKHSRKLNWDGL